MEAEFTRKARVIAQEKADQYDPDKAMDQIAKLLAKGYVSTVDRPSLINTPRKDEPYTRPQPGAPVPPLTANPYAKRMRTRARL